MRRHLTGRDWSGQEFDHWLVNGVVCDTQDLYLDAAQVNGSSFVEVTLCTRNCKSGKLVINEVYAKGNHDWIELKNVGVRQLICPECAL